jgi:hypothetical protein
LGCPSHQIKQTQPQQILKMINEFALEYRTKRERVREMLMRKQQCQHNHHNHGNRWQMNRMRWAGSQQCIDSMNFNNRPCSTASSIASSSYATNNMNLNCPECALNARHRSTEPSHHANQHGASHRPGSPSGLSQISNYSDYLLDQSCCSRQESITPVPTNGINRRPHSMSVSMYDLQQQQQQQNCHDSSANDSDLAANKSLDESELARQKDEQMRRLLGGGKSLDGACHDLYQMRHWSSTMARTTRHPPISNKQRASSIDTPSGGKPVNAERENSFDASFATNESMSPRRQSSYYRYLHGNGNNCHMEDEQNSDEEILQSLVRTATAKSSHQHQNGSHSNRSSAAGNCNDSTNSNDSATSIRSAKSKILSRFNCDRKSCKYYCLALVGLFLHILIGKFLGS